jgi:protocatechuate 3,4-dioxygenase beta subunit
MTRTRDDGTFTLKGVAAGEARVVALDRFTQLRSPGKTDDDTAGEKVTVTAGETARVKIVIERRSGTIKGRVVDAKGAPVVDAFISVNRESERAGAAQGTGRRMARWSWEARPVVTDTDGTFVAEKLAPGKYTVHAHRRGGGEGVLEHVEIGSTVTVTIAETASIAGTVKVASGRALDLFLVRVNDRESGLSREERFYRTGGAWRLAELPPGSYEIVGEASEGTDTEKLSLAQGENKTGVALVLEGRATLTGVVLDAREGKPVEGMHVMASAADGGFSWNPGQHDDKRNITDAQGRFTVEQAPTGKVRVQVFPVDWMGSTYGWSSTVVDVAPGATLEVPPIKVAERRLSPGERRGDLGFSIKEQKPGAEDSEFVAEVSFVRADGPAAAAGLVVGDVIVAVDGLPVAGQPAMWWSLVAAREGTKLSLSLVRGVTIELVVGKPL